MVDVIVVGARCAGSPLSMLLARLGHRVFLVYRATFPSDTISTHFIWPTGVACLKRWGLFDRLRATGCPPVRELGLDPGPFQFKGSPTPAGDVGEMFGPRRTVLDKLLVDAAREAGVQVAEGFSASGLIRDGDKITGIRGRTRDGKEIEEHAAIVVGADGRHSLVASTVGAEAYNVRPVRTCFYYSYWRDVPPHILFIRARENRVLITSRRTTG